MGASKRSVATGSCISVGSVNSGGAVIVLMCGTTVFAITINVSEGRSVVIRKRKGSTVKSMLELMGNSSAAEVFFLCKDLDMVVDTSDVRQCQDRNIRLGGAVHKRYLVYKELKIMPT